MARQFAPPSPGRHRQNELSSLEMAALRPKVGHSSDRDRCLRAAVRLRVGAQLFFCSSGERASAEVCAWDVQNECGRAIKAGSETVTLKCYYTGQVRYHGLLRHLAVLWVPVERNAVVLHIERSTRALVRMSRIEL